MGTIRKAIALTVAASLMLLMFGCAGISVEEPRINPSSFPDIYRFHSDSDRSFQYILRTAPRIVIGEVVGITEEGSRRRYLIHIHRCVDKKISGETVLFSHPEQLNKGDSYLLFLRNQVNDIYVAWHGLTLAVDENGTLWQLPNRRTNSYAPPFENEQYNELDTLLAYIASVRKGGPPPLHFIFSQLPRMFNFRLLLFLWGSSIMNLLGLFVGSIDMYLYFRTSRTS